MHAEMVHWLEGVCLQPDHHYSRQLQHLEVNPLATSSVSEQQNRGQLLWKTFLPEIYPALFVRQLEYFQTTSYQEQFYQWLKTFVMVSIFKCPILMKNSYMSNSQAFISVSPARSLIMNWPPTIVPSLLRIALPLLYIFNRLIVSEVRILESPFFGAVRPGLEEALDLLSMLVLPFAGVCLVYFHPVFGMV
jgi:hypothetical protein